ncbi:MAG: hypothetical protein COS67_00650 [Deltaproteobacteria bacterium CG06_land_8_20_14_3_00_44_19]|nr:MAG: hypothetical protein COX52_13040 [Syntrophobacterales bacterium CG23_combo_of_CG06-09_8_20_14_all_48_27]PIU86783.1 MAG: hypothetical protein COS67_00650 [Deltaproteobacteria bacterium CG06_land_8_20_14_3_00_44_19]
MNLIRLIAVSVIAICSVLFFCSTGISGEYKSATFPNDQVIASQAWQDPRIMPVKIFGKQKISNDEYRLFYLSKEGEVNVMTVIKLDTNLWYHSKVVGLEEGIFTELKK